MISEGVLRGILEIITNDTSGETFSNFDIILEQGTMNPINGLGCTAHPVREPQIAAVSFSHSDVPAVTGHHGTECSMATYQHNAIAGLGSLNRQSGLVEALGPYASPGSRMNGLGPNHVSSVRAKTTDNLGSFLGIKWLGVGE
jgi:hypothetical protein